jgi:hypothetical protein
MFAKRKRRDDEIVRTSRRLQRRDEIANAEEQTMSRPLLAASCRVPIDGTNGSSDSATLKPNNLPKAK